LASGCPAKLDAEPLGANTRYVVLARGPGVGTVPS
jgi:hypothetical protein